MAFYCLDVFFSQTRKDASIFLLYYTTLQENLIYTEISSPPLQAIQLGCSQQQPSLLAYPRNP